MSKASKFSNIEEIIKDQDTVDFIEALAITFKDITAEKIVDLLPKLIGYVQKYKKLSGDQQKALIISLLNIIIDKIVMKKGLTKNKVNALAIDNSDKEK